MKITSFLGIEQCMSYQFWCISVMRKATTVVLYFVYSVVEGKPAVLKNH